MAIVSNTTRFLTRILAFALLSAGSWSLWAQEELEPIEVSADEVGVAEPEDSESIEAEETFEAPEVEEELSEEELLDQELKRLRRERDLLSIRNSIRSEELKQELAELREEKERLSLENSLFKARTQADLLEHQATIDRMSAEIDAINKGMALANAQSQAELQETLAETRRREQELAAEAALAQKEASIEMERLRLAETQLKLRRTELETQFAELQARISIRDKEEEVRDLVDVSQQIYAEEPYRDGVLQISDRRIALNGPIGVYLSSYVSERINFYNNQSTEYPIFIVIDSSPGGSVWAGYRILEAMDASEAPVYVVVKSYAASMAAIITTLAEKSFAYPNAIILHHELSWYGVSGNLSRQSEYQEDAKEWWRRLATPVAAKMGVTLQEFRALMYEKSSAGDWQEFADVAKEYGWVDEIVDKIWETSIDRNPDRYGKQFWASAEQEVLKDEKGRSYVELPRLEPYDFYFIYNPDGYYRIPQ
ncbi:ATP-dependent Clp protease proteolytic subunit [Pelagicoccus sp. SDUM812003]|uniref:ATP-dependent Clp protease proteolytic subunit n=1 Tax=Pelagicoccus sp. SDUM812003 TaxID=3041267 RepID=UPI00280CD4EC|nr:ATP-dependent Clp protease proteolytic subunit [Pelagicoccus sp. SDUM812003]MDQ8204921.1 ATP-dependent Clp protease proteolytic subunit [Pelagicoccus sp. SDUM812003]